MKLDIGEALFAFGLLFAVMAELLFPVIGFLLLPVLFFVCGVILCSAQVCVFTDIILYTRKRE